MLFFNAIVFNLYWKDLLLCHLENRHPNRQNVSKAELIVLIKTYILSGESRNFAAWFVLFVSSL